MDYLAEPLSPMAQCFDSSSLRTYILAVFEFEAAFPYKSLVPSLQTLLSFPRFTSILVRDKINGVKRWERVEVKLEDHIIEPTISWEDMSKDSYAKCFSEYLSNISLEHLPYSKPLWQVHLINNSTDTTLVFKVHHSIGDGFTFMGVILSCLKRADDPSLPLTFPSLKSSNNRSSSHGRSLPCFISTIFTGIKYFGWSLLKSSLVEDDKTPVRSGNERVEFQPVVISSIIFPMDRIKDIKSKLGVTVNDVITGVIFLGIRLYMQDVESSSRTKNCTLLTVLNTRNVQSYQTAKDMKKSDEGTRKGSTTWGNQCSFMHVSVPKLKDTQTCDDPLRFVRKVHHKMKKMKRLSLVYALLGMLMKMKHQFKGPEAVAKHMHKTMRNSSFLMSNMIGPLDQMAAANCPIKSFYFTLSGAPQSLAITVISYMGMLRVTTRTEEGFIDEKKLASYLNDAFEIIHKAALETPANKPDSENMPKILMKL